MTALHDTRFPVPTPLGCNRHVVVMSLVPGKTLSLLKSLPDPAPIFDRLMAILLRLAAAGIVHCDFNEFNLLVDLSGEGRAAWDAGVEGTVASPAAAAAVAAAAAAAAAEGIVPASKPSAPIVTLIDFPQMVSIDHPNAAELFDRDVGCLVTWFRKR
jgi:RIO kinase 2